MSERVSDRAAIAASIFLSLSLFSCSLVLGSATHPEMIIIEAAATGALAGVPMSVRSGWDTVRVQIDFLDHSLTHLLDALC
jgi:hypothetical protein